MSAESRGADDLAAVWRQQLVKPLTLTPAELQAENQLLRRKVRYWLLVEYASCAVVIAAFLMHWLFSENSASTVTYLAFVVATLWVMRGLHVRLGDRGEVPPPVELLAFQRDPRAAAVRIDDSLAVVSAAVRAPNRDRRDRSIVVHADPQSPGPSHARHPHRIRVLRRSLFPSLCGSGIRSWPRACNDESTTSTRLEQLHATKVSNQDVDRSRRESRDVIDNHVYRARH
jgi:hypothetical protein